MSRKPAAKDAEAAEKADGGAPLPRSFYERPTLEVAPALLGKLLIRPGAPARIARIVEVEAYLGERDAASHARRGPTPRASTMFGPPGFLYVYMIYGMHHCMNIVTEANGIAGAVLLRAAVPLGGFATPTGAAATAGTRLLTGPGKMCAGFGITRAHNGADLCGSEFYLADDAGGDGEPRRIKRSARIGVAYAGAWAGRKLRFYLAGDPHVSGRPRD